MSENKSKTTPQIKPHLVTNNKFCKYEQLKLRQVTAAIIQNIGFSTANSLSVSSLTFLFRTYFERLCKDSREIASQAGREEVNVEDVSQVFDKHDVNLSELHEYMHQVAQFPLNETVPEFPVSMPISIENKEPEDDIKLSTELQVTENKCATNENVETEENNNGRTSQMKRNFRSSNIRLTNQRAFPNFVDANARELGISVCVIIPPTVEISADCQLVKSDAQDNTSFTRYYADKEVLPSFSVKAVPNDKNKKREEKRRKKKEKKEKERQQELEVKVPKIKIKLGPAAIPVKSSPPPGSGFPVVPSKARESVLDQPQSEKNKEKEAGRIQQNVVIQSERKKEKEAKPSQETVVIQSERKKEKEAKPAQEAVVIHSERKKEKEAKPAQEAVVIHSERKKEKEAKPAQETVVIQSERKKEKETKAIVTPLPLVKKPKLMPRPSKEKKEAEREVHRPKSVQEDSVMARRVGSAPHRNNTGTRPASSAAIGTSSKTSTRATPGSAKKAAEKSNEPLWICPICTMAYVDNGPEMIGCDQCDRWFHWSCVGILIAPPENVKWYCRECRMAQKKQLLQKQPRSGSGSRKSSFGGETGVGGTVGGGGSQPPAKKPKIMGK